MCRTGRHVVALIAAASVAFPAAAGGLRSAFAYRLADANGDLPLRWVTLNWDAAAEELYVVDSSNGTIQIFNDAGMQVFAFGDDAALGRVLGIAPMPNGEMVALSSESSHWSLLRCNFRGDPQAKIEVTGIPFKDFYPTAMRVSNGTLYLADKGTLRIVAVGIDGSVRNSWDLHSLLKLSAKKGANGDDLRGFNVDASGNILGTIPGLFLAFVVAPDGIVRSFGTRGGAPGKFNVVAGIASDDAGRLYVADTLKCAVLVFDKDGKFIDQFGYRGDDDEEGLIAPQDIAVVQGKVFVSQSRGGVKAFDILLD